MDHHTNGSRPGRGTVHANGLGRLAANLRWAWHDPTRALFRELDGALWEETRHNPVAMLRIMSAEALERRMADPSLRARVDALAAELERYLEDTDTWWATTHGHEDDGPTAYFSAEFGLTECMSVYSGGLGVLAGDHLKSASDLGIPLVGVGLLYREGYFRQHIAESGAQTESYRRLDFDALPLERLRDEDGRDRTVALAFPGRQVFARIWRAAVGRVPLLMLDTDLDANDADDRAITARLYGGDNAMRIAQEIVLGIGGLRALDALGIRPGTYHMNEGHSAFLALEQVRTTMHREGLDLEEAVRAAARGNVFTTHTPVPAGHDRFSPELMATYFTSFARELDEPLERILALGRQEPDDAEEPFSMTVLALNVSAYRNGVSRLHGAVSRAMLRGLWPDRPVDDVPIGHITNGVHLDSWAAPELKALLDEHVPGWRRDGGDREAWARLASVSDETLWELRRSLRTRLVEQVRARIAAVDGSDADRVEPLDPDALTIGFARRFATYKRATLLLRDVDRLDRLLNDTDRPVQILFAGKAHPRDKAGKSFIREIVRLSHEPRFRGRILFLENYDIALARALVQGADVWLNNPRRPQEASGTSGMKAAVNGGLNVSVLDGWWDEAYRDAEARGVALGWAIGEGLAGEDVGGRKELDRRDAASLYAVLEKDVVPTFYDREETGRPAAWIARVRNAIMEVGPAFNTHRMVRDYVERYYLRTARVRAPAR